jgi:hypothetical protein
MVLVLGLAAWVHVLLELLLEMNADLQGAVGKWLGVCGVTAKGCCCKAGNAYLTAGAAVVAVRAGALGQVPRAPHWLAEPAGSVKAAARQLAK